MADIREYRRQTGNYEDIDTPEEYFAQGEYEWRMHQREGSPENMWMDIEEYASMIYLMCDEEGEYDEMTLPMCCFATDNLDGSPFGA